MTSAAATSRATRAWPELAQRRGSWAAAILLIALAPVTFSVRSSGPIVPWFLVMTVLGLALLGPGSVRRVFGSRATPAAMAAALAIGLANAVLHLGLATLVPNWPAVRRAPHEIAAGIADLLLLFGVVSALVLPLVSECLFRGVLWVALRRVLGPATTILAATVAFAICQGFGEYRGFPLSFLFGLALGWLRHRSGSLAPCLLAHSINNLALTLAFYCRLAVIW